MFCPQCGQPAAEGVRFCQRCGLSLTPHAALLTGQQPAAPVPAGTQPPARTKKRIRARRAAKLMFFSVVLLPVFIAFGIAADEGGPILVPFFMFMTGLAWWIYVRLFVDDDLPQVTHDTSQRDLRAGVDQPALGAAQFVPASLFNQQTAHTSEISPPRSVTENTTTLLDKDV